MAQNVNLGMKCIKYMLFIANFMFVMVGVLLISFGSTIKSIYYDFEIFMEDHYFSPAKLIVAIGIIILLISAFGCAAAIKESTCMVNMFALLLTLVLILEVSASIAAYAMRANIRVFMKDKMEIAMKGYLADEEYRGAVDFLQTRMECCGVFNDKDWQQYHPNHTFTIRHNETSDYPESCCRRLPTSPICFKSNYGCLDRLSILIKESSVMLGTGALCIAFVQILGIAFAVMLAKSIRRLKTEREALRWHSRQEWCLQVARANEKPAETPVTYTVAEADA